MASLGPQRFCPTPPHFFQIILDDTSRLKLNIPKKFVMKYGKDFSSLVTLKLPSGSEWEVELTRCEGKVWFDKGWPEFFMDSSPDYGSFLVFRYEGNSRFHVCIFDTSATEIDYPITTPKIVEVHDDNDLSPLPYHPHKKMRTSLSGKADMVSEREKTQPCSMFKKPIANEDAYCSKSEAKSVENKEKDGGVTGRFLKQTSNQLLLGNALALRKAYDLETERPSFTVSLQPSDIQCSLSLPFEFAKRHLMKHPASTITLLVMDGTKCSVDFTYSEQNAKFQRGWLTFVNDNNLEVGDVCVFILIKDVKLVLKVVLFRTYEVTNHFLFHGENGFVTKRDGGSSSSTERFLKPTQREVIRRVKQLTATEKANAFKAPSCQVSLLPSSVGYDVMSLPNAFAKKYLKDLPVRNAILRVSNDTWSVKFKYDHANSRARLLCGWLSFVRDNKLKTGDVCVFSLINSVELLFEVAIYPTEECSTGHGRGETEHESNINSEIGVSSSLEVGKNKENKVKGKVTHRPFSSLRTTTVNLDDANKFSSKNPFFMATIGLRHLKKSTVNVPVNFVRSVMTLNKPGKHKVLLQVKDSSWPVNLSSYKPFSTRIHGGWTAFAKEHGIREGDVCVFELIKINEIVLKVHIFRR